MSEGKRRSGVVAKVREKRRLKRERTGDSPERRAERSRHGAGSDASVAENAGRAAVAGYLAGGV